MRELINSLSIEILLMMALAMSFVISYVSIPSIVSVAKAKNLNAEPNNRTSHLQSTPVLGGMAIFAGFVVSILILDDVRLFPEIKFVIASLVILFFIGAKDDILDISPKNKLIGQLIASGIIIFLGDLRITDLHGLMGIHAIPYLLSVAITFFLIVLFINCFNLIDGIDGLATTLSIIGSLGFGIWFYLTNEFEYAIIAAALIGALVAFFQFNVYGKKNKIFMGDTGSMTLGFLMVLMVIRFNEMNIQPVFPYAFRAAPAVSFGFLIVPLLDTLRVFAVRVYRGHSPFRPDRTHIHHFLIRLGNTHIQSTLILGMVSLVFIWASVKLGGLNVNLLFAILTFSGLSASLIPVYLLKRREHIISEHKRKYRAYMELRPLGKQKLVKAS